MRRLPLFIAMATLILLASCGTTKAPRSSASFEKFVPAFMESYWHQFPSFASYVGNHDYDSVLMVPDHAYRDASVAFAKQYLDSLDAYNPDSLPPLKRIDWMMLHNELSRIVWEADTFKAWERDASQYNIGTVTGQILKGRFAPLEERLNSIFHRLDKVEPYYQTATEMVHEPSLPQLEMGILQNEGTLNLLQEGLRDSVIKSSLTDTLKEEFKHRIAHAAEAVEKYVTHLRNLKAATEDHRDFRIGSGLYKQKFKYDLISSYDPETIFQIAFDQKDEAHTMLLRLTQKLWPKYYGERLMSITLENVQQMIDTLSHAHSTPESFIGDIRAQLPELVDFVEDNDLIYLDPEKPLTVREAPGYLQGIALVSISAPGPFDKDEDTYYNVNDLTNYPEETSESYLREYNDYMLQILNIHEAIPGHYTQLVYANQSPSLVKSVFGNTAMIEGWACYAERMMLEAGYGDNADELWLMYYKWYLRIICNTIIDIGVHTQNWDKEQVMKLLTEEAFQEQSEAEGKWMRVQRSQVQLCSYFTGLTEIFSLREEMRGKLGDDFDIKTFNEAFLQYGSAPVPYIRQLMLDKINKNGHL